MAVTDSTVQTNPFPPIAAEIPRVLGSYDRGVTGPLLVITAGIHGNEPASVHALGRVFKEIEQLKPPLTGRVVALVGNRGALAQDVRYLDTDMNRLWSESKLTEIAAADPKTDKHERKEQRELVALIEKEVAAARGRVTMMDLHSTSGDGPPFIVLDDTPENRKLASALYAPAILGLVKSVEGTIVDYAKAKGHACVILEGGQNRAPTTIDHHESAVWIMLVEAGLLAEKDCPAIAQHRARMKKSADGLPGAVEVCLRYAVEPEEHFEMLPGFRSFQPVSQGQLLALGGRSGQRPIRCPIGAILLMPRYQGQGADGFFLARTVNLVA